MKIRIEIEYRDGKKEIHDCNDQFGVSEGFLWLYKTTGREVVPVASVEKIKSKMIQY